MSSKRHFGMDERGLGGTYMIQQQFLDMYRKIHHAKKTVDNDPPTTSMFRRPYFSRFGDYYKRIPKPTIQVSSKVDTSAPDSYVLIADLYINQPRSATKKKPSAKDKAAASRQHSPSLGDTTKSGRSSIRDLKEPSDVMTSMEEYMQYCDARRASIKQEMIDLKKRRLIRLRGLSASARRSLGSSMSGTAAQGLSAVAQATLGMMDRKTPDSRPATAGSQPTQEFNPLTPTEAQEALMRTLQFSADDVQSPVGRVPRPPPRTGRPGSAGNSSRGDASPVKRRTDFGPPVSELVIPKKNVFQKPAPPAARSGSPNSHSRQHHHHRPFGVVPYDAEEAEEVHTTHADHDPHAHHQQRAVAGAAVHSYHDDEDDQEPMLIQEEEEEEY